MEQNKKNHWEEFLYSRFCCLEENNLITLILDGKLYRMEIVIVRPKGKYFSLGRRFTMRILFTKACDIL